MTKHDYNAVKISRQLLTKIFSHITIQNTGYKSDCWLFHPHNLDHYSAMYWNDISYCVHRLMYALFVEYVDPALFCDHLCRTPSCVNPEHIEPVTPKENTSRFYRMQTHCKRGHLFTPENTKLERGRRVCRICKRITAQERKIANGIGRRDDVSTHCLQGHPYTKETVYIRPNGRIGYCRQCRRKSSGYVPHPKKPSLSSSA